MLPINISLKGRVLYSQIPARISKIDLISRENSYDVYWLLRRNSRDSGLCLVSRCLQAPAHL